MPPLAGTLSYATAPIVTTVGTATSAVATLAFTGDALANGATAEYAISLSTTGISINPTTGEISVAANAAVAGTTPYTVTVRSPRTHQGNVTGTVNITIVLPTLVGAFSYVPIIRTYGDARANFSSPTVTTAFSTGAAVTYSINPSANPGITVEGITVNELGQVSVSSTAVISSSGQYIVSASADGFDGTITSPPFLITIKAIELLLTYSNVAIVGLQGSTITPASLTLIPSGATVTEYAINPALPTGLVFSTSTGEISGSLGNTPGTIAYEITTTGTGNYASAEAAVSTTISIIVNAPDDIPITGIFSYVNQSGPAGLGFAVPPDGKEQLKIK